jgi:hypothetical protein
MDTELLRGVGAGCESNLVSRARAPWLLPASPPAHTHPPRSVFPEAGSHLTRPSPRSQREPGTCKLAHGCASLHRRGGAPGGAAPRAEHTHARMHRSDPGLPMGCCLTGTTWLSPLARPALVSSRAHSASNCGVGSVKMGRPRTPRAVALSGSWRPMSSEAQPVGASATLPAARLEEPDTVPPCHSPSGAPTAAPYSGRRSQRALGKFGTGLAGTSPVRPTVQDPVNGRGAGRNPQTARGEPVASR